MSVLDVVVVGAGPAGLIMTKLLKAQGANFQVYERHNDVGGIWDIDAENSPMYESAHFISSRTLSGFPDFPMPSDYPDYPNHTQILAYIRDYAKANALYDHIAFNREIVTAKQIKSGKQKGFWELHFKNATPVVTKYLVCANGVTWEPNRVSWQGQASFTGEVRHANTYRSPQEFEGKNVLVVGAGNSGVDIACDAAFAAKQAFLSVRRGYHFIPKHIMGKPADVFAEEGPQVPFFIEQRVFGAMLRVLNGDVTQYGLPKPDHKVFETHPIMNTQILHYLGHGDCIAKADIREFDGNEVVFKDGSRESIDLVITATGYKHDVPFLPEGTLAYKKGRPDLYMNMFSRKHKNLAVLGFIEFASAAYANFYDMAELIVADALGDAPKLAKLKRAHRPDLTGRHHYLATERNANYVDVKTYKHTLSKVKKRVGLQAY